MLKGGVNREMENRQEYEATTKFSALEALQESGKTLIIEDFHHIHPEIRRAIVQFFKGPVESGLRVILVSVPHRGFDAVRAERDLALRVEHLQIPPWRNDELAQIAAKGFSTLNAECDATVTMMLSSNSYGSPLLMQMLCRQVCDSNHFAVSSHGQLKRLSFIEPAKSFGDVASVISSDLEALLAARPQSERTQYELSSGGKGDYYILTLLALAELLPETKISSRDVFLTAQRLMRKPKMLQQNQVTSALTRMSAAAGHLPGERIMEWDGDTTTVNICDAGLAFQIKWGNWWRK